MTMPTPPALRRGGLHALFDPVTGGIEALGNDHLDLELVGRVAAAEAWRLLIPLPGQRGNYVRSREQRLRTAAHDENGRRLRLTWGPLASDIGELEIDVTLDVAISEDDELTFRLEIDNRSPYPVEEVLSPCIGGVARPTDPDRWRLVAPRVISGGMEVALFDEVPASYHGPRRPNLLFPYPGGWTHPLALGMPWVSIGHPDGRSVYLGNHDDNVAFSAFWVEFDAQLRFDTRSTAALSSSAQQRWPEPQSDPDASATLGWVDFPFLAPGERYQGPPIVIRFHADGWRGSAARFRRAHGARLGESRRPHSWASDTDAWLTVVMMFNDGKIAVRASGLSGLAEEAAAAGISAILLAGWSIGGLDGGMPDYHVDPRLGSEDDFRQALEACRERGVRVMLMAQIGQVVAGTEWFRAEGYRYVVRHADGNPYFAGGVYYGWNTLLDQLGYSAPQIVTANPAHPSFRTYVTAQLEHILDLGADGVLLDKLNTGDPFCLDYNEDLPGTPSTRFHAALIDTLRAFVEIACNRDPAFAITAETGWDRAMPYVDAAYTRYFDREHLPVQELTFPEVRLTTTIVGNTDRAMVNNALRYGHVICVEPGYFHARPADVPDLVAYVRETIRLRRLLRGLLWDGRLVDDQHVVVSGQVLHSVFAGAPQSAAGAGISTPDESPIAVVVSHFETDGREVRIDVRRTVRHGVIHRPFRAPERVELPLTADVPPGEFFVLTVGDPGPVRS